MLLPPETRPRLSAAWQGRGLSDGATVLFGEAQTAVVQGRVLPQLVPLMDGTRTTDEIVAAVEASAAEVHFVLAKLAQDGYVTIAPLDVPPEQEAYWARTEAAGTAAPVASLVTVGDVPEDVLRDELARGGVAIGKGGVPVVAAQDYTLEALDAVNRRQLGDGRPWLLCKPVGATVWLGPLFRPGETGCWACLAERVRAYRPVDGLAVPAASLPSTVQAAAGLLATAVAHIAATGTYAPLEGAVVSLDTHTLETERHVLTRRPQCPACGMPHHAPVQPQFDSAAGVVPPHVTFERYAHHISPITGVVKALRRREQPDLDGLAYTYSAGHRWPVTEASAEAVRRTLYDRSAGKGTTDAQARASALGESLERVSGIFTGDEPRRRATLAELGEAAIHPHAFLQYSAAQYADRHAWNAAHPLKAYHIPAPFDDTQLVEWTALWSLRDEGIRYLPTTLCYYGHAERRFGVADSNGCAAGNTLAEAAVQGFCELVERDAVSIWWHNRLRRPALDLDSLGVPYLLDLRRAYRQRLGRDLWLLDLTHDLGLPVFAAVSCAFDAPEAPVLGFGCHFDARRAAIRAATEVNQTLPHLAAHTPTHERYTPGDAVAHAWYAEASRTTQPYLVPDPNQPATRLADLPSLDASDPADAVAHCVRIAAAHGLDCLLLDQTRPDIGMPVVRVVVPGLRHFWRRLAPGRLYDVPVAMGWHGKALAEHVVNPIPLFL